MSESLESNAAPEIEAIGAVHAALHKLEADAQMRVIRYVAELLDLPLARPLPLPREHVATPTQQVFPTPPTQSHEEAQPREEEEGISPVALKWMRRNGFTAAGLQTLFSIGLEEIDLVAKSVPGKSTRAKLRSVILLKGIAAYLSGGVARISFDELKEACLHYNAWDQTNFAATMKSLASEVGGSKEGGYTLSPRGLGEASEIVKELTSK